MKRFVIGFLFGALIFGGSSVLADDVSWVGKSIDGELPIYYNGEPLVAKAIVVNGTSFLPVRTIGNTLGAQVEYRDGAVYVERENEREYEKLKQQVMNDLKIETRKEELRKEIAKLQAANENLKARLAEVEKDIQEGIASGGFIGGSEQAKQIIENTIQANQQKIQQLEAELAALSSETPE